MAKLNSKSLCRCETGALANKRFSVATPPHGIIAFNRVKPSIGRNLVSGRAKRAPLVYDDTLVRQIIEAVIVESKEKIKVIFIGGYEIEQYV